MTAMNDFLKAAIRNEVALNNVDVEILKINKSSGSRNTENFIGKLEAIEVEAKVGESIKTFNYMAKTIPKDKEAFVRKIYAFEKETSMYETIIPRFREMGDKVGLHAPKCFFASNTDGVIIMENLKVKGFSMVNSKFGMKTRHIKWALDEFARLHAYSHVLISSEENEEISEMIKVGKVVDFSDTKDYIEAIYRGQIKALCYAGKEDLAKRFEAIIPEAQPIMEAIFTDNKSQFPVLNHGDGWTNNFMFKHDNKGGISEGILLDWQFIVRGSPATDLANFFGLSLAPKERENKKKELLQFYYERLSMHAKNLGLDLASLYSIASLNEEYESRFSHLYILTAQMLPIFYMKQESVAENTYESEQRLKLWEDLSLKIAKRDPEFIKTLVDLHEDAATKGFI